MSHVIKILFDHLVTQLQLPQDSILADWDLVQKSGPMKKK